MHLMGTSAGRRGLHLGVVILVMNQGFSSFPAGSKEEERSNEDKHVAEGESRRVAVEASVCPMPGWDRTMCRCVDGSAWGWLPEGIAWLLPAGECELRRMHIHALLKYLLQLSALWYMLRGLKRAI